MKKTQRIISIILSVALIVSACAVLVACKSECDKNGHQYVQGICTVCGETDPDYHEHIHAYGVDGFCSCGECDPTATYTQRSSTTLMPTTWNPFTYKSSNDSTVLDYTTDNFYAFDYRDINDHTKGFDIVPSMASADPVDVTSQYVGRYGVAEGETGKAFEIKLKSGLAFEDGTPITAQTYVESYKRLLDPEMANYRASNYYTGSPSIVGSKTYAQNGWAKWVSARDAFGESYDSAKDAELIFSLGATNKDVHAGAISYLRAKYQEGYENYGMNTTQSGGDYIVNLAGAFGAPVPATAEAINALEGKSLAEIKADATFNATFEALKGFWCTEDYETIDFCVYYLVNEEVEFEGTVGVIAVDDTTLHIVYNSEIVGFYIKYSISLPIVNIAKYDASIVTDATTGAKSSTYGTTYESYIGCSYGPYKLTQLAPDQKMVFERNDTYFAYDEAYADEYGTVLVDGKEIRQYQADKIEIIKVANVETREQMFNSGELDALGLNAALLTKYEGGDLIYTVGYSTYYGIITSDFDALKARQTKMNGGNENDLTYVNTILANKKFRQALSYAIDREAMCKALYPAGTAAFGLYSDGIIADPANGKAYHDFDEAKQAVVNVWGIEYGEGKTFATLDAAYNSIKGFDLEKARELLEEAVAEEIEAGRMTANSIVRIYHNESSESDTSKLWHSTFQGYMNTLVKGTSLEGKLEYLLDTSLGDNFSAGINAGLTDCAWGFGWTGSALDPWGLCEVYVDAAYKIEEEPYQYDPYNNFDEIYGDVTIAIDFGEGEKDYAFTLSEWWAISVGASAEQVGSDRELPNGAFGKIADSYRAKILAAIEEKVLLHYTTIPLMNQGSVQLNSYKVRYYDLDNYIYGVGYGGTRYMTFYYTDAAWAEFVASQGGTLKYNG